MKALIALFLTALSLNANAFDFEMGYGQAHFKHDHNGRWYVEGYPHFSELNDTAMSLGVSHKFGVLRYRLEYFNLGEVRMAAQFPDDSRYTPFNNAAASEYLIFGRGRVAGAVVSASRDFTLAGLPLYTEAGAFIHRPEWRVAVYNSQTMQYLGELERKSELRVGPVFGIGVRYGAVDIGVRYLHMEAGGVVPAYYVGAYTLMAKVIF